MATGLGDRPRFRQRLRLLPLRQGVAWVDDEDFDIAHHVWSEALPPPGDDAQLREWVAKVLEQPLDTSRPLWEVRVLTGLGGDRVAVLVKANHSLVDGTVLVDLVGRLFDEAHEVAPTDEPPVWRPDPVPAALSLVAIEVRARAAQVADGIHQAAGLLTDPRVLGGAVRAVTGTLLGAARSVLEPGRAGASRPPVTGRVGPRRDVVWARLPLDDVRRIAHSESVTVNDVVLALATEALSGYLQVHPGDPPARAPRVLVPVSIHTGPAGDEVRNRFSVVVTGLPTGIDDPLERLHHIHHELVREKVGAASSAGARVYSVAGLLPSPVLRAAAQAALDRQTVADLAVTNLIAPAGPVHLLGARMLEVHPMVTGTGNIALIIGVLSYDGALGVCVTVDADVITDPEVVLHGFPRGLADLLAATEATDPGP